MVNSTFYFLSFGLHIEHNDRAGFLPNSDRVILDTHPYFAFSGSSNTNPLSEFDVMPCNDWAGGMNASQRGFGITVAGEFSNAVCRDITVCLNNILTL